MFNFAQSQCYMIKKKKKCTYIYILKHFLNKYKIKQIISFDTIQCKLFSDLIIPK